jgi:bla regulator protein BlaR1
MQTLLVEYAIRTSLIAAVVALVLYVMRIKTASARHAVWAGVVLVMLLLPAWLVWGPKAALPLLPSKTGRGPASAPPIDALPRGAGLRPATYAAPAAPPQPMVWSWPEFLAAVYLLGACALLLRLAIGTVRTRRLASVTCVVPVTVGFFRPRIILPECSSQWAEARLEAVLAHEREHARRRDPLVQWVALLNRALFWFHPLAWWLERRLSGLAEEACDAAVLAQGHDPHDYSETLLDLSRSVELAGKRLNVVSTSGAMAMPGTFLPQRIRRMLSGVPAPRISRPRLACAAAVCATAAALLTAGTLVRAQSKSQPGPTFEVATVKPITPNAGPGGGRGKGGGGRGGGAPPGLSHGRFSFSSSLAGLILKAYGVNGCGLLGENDCPMLTGGPIWLRKDYFDIQAKMPDNSPDYNLMQFFDGEAPQLQLMLQALLAERFNLKLHRETKELPVYVLTIGKRGAKLNDAAEAKLIQLPDGSTVRDRSMLWTAARQPNGEVEAGILRMIMRDRSMQEFADALSNVMDRPVLNRTGLQGEFDISIDYEREPDTSDSADNASRIARDFGPSFVAALQEQLGLKLEATKAPVEVLVIDHAEQPSPN